MVRSSLFACVAVVVLCSSLVLATEGQSSPSSSSSYACSNKKVESPECGGNLAVVYRYGDDVTNCSLVHLDYKNGYLFNVSKLSVCKDRNDDKDGLPHSAFDREARLLFYTSGTGASIHVIDNLAGNSSVFASLPTDSSYIVGLYTSDSTLYVLSVDALYSASYADNVFPQTLALLYKFQESWSEDSIAAVGNGFLYIFNGNTILNTFSLPSSSSSSSSVEPVASVEVKGGLERPMDLQYRYTSSLVILDSYQLFELPVQDGTIPTPSVNFLTRIPDGPGFPRVNDLFLDLFYFSDFTNVFSIDLSYNNTLSKPAPFNSFFCQGYFHYF